MTVKRAVFSPPPGTILGETDYSIPGQWSASNNVRYVSGKAQPIGGWDELVASAGVTDYCVSMLEWIAKDGTRYLALGNTGNARVLSGSALATKFTITPTGFSSGIANRWTFDLWGENLIGCWSGHGVYEYVPASGVLTAITNAPNTNTICMVTPGTRQLMVFGTKEEVSGTFNPRCIRWSHTENNTSWASLPSNLAGEYILDGAGGSIRAAKKIGDYVAVWTDDELFLGQFTGDPNNPWVFQRQAIGCGCTGTDAATVADGAAYWISTDLRLMGWIPGSAPFELPGVPKNYLFGSATIGSAPLSFTWHNRQFNEVWFHIPVSGAFPTTYLAVSVPSLQTERPIWFSGTMSRSCMYQGINGCYGYDGVSTLVLYKHETGMNGHSAGLNTSLLSWSASALVYFDQGQRRVMINRLLPDVEAQAGNITCTISKLDYPQGAETTLQTKTLAVGDDKSDFRASGKLFRIQFSGNDGVGATSTFARLGKMTFEYEMLGDR